MIKKQFSLSKKVLVALVAASVTSSVSAAPALAATKTASTIKTTTTTPVTSTKQTITLPTTIVNTSTFEVDGVKSSVKSITFAGAHLYSLNDVARTLKLTAKQDTKTKQTTISGTNLKLVFDINSKVVVVNGAKKTVANAVKEVNGLSFAQIDTLLNEMGYCYSITAGNLILNKATTDTSAFEVDGVKSSVKTIIIKAVQLYSINDLAQALNLTVKQDAKTKQTTVTGENLKMIFDVNSKTVVVNDVKKSLDFQVKEFNGLSYATIEIFANELNGYYSRISTNSVSFTKLLSGDSEVAGWIDKSQMLIANETETGLDFYIVNVDTRRYQKVLGSDLNVTAAVPSPDGKSIAYINTTGDVFVYYLESRLSEKVSSDDSIKYELQWSKTGDRLFFIQGDKSDVITQITLADKKTKKVLEDKVNYKAELKVSSDGQQFLYTVTKDGKVTGTDETDITVDTTNTEPQIFTLDTTVEGAKPKQLTTSTDNKVYADFVGYKGYSYISYNTEDEAAIPVIAYMDKSANKTVIIPADLTVIQSVAYNGKSMLLAEDGSGKKALYVLDFTLYSLKKVCELTDSVSKIFVSSDGINIAAEVTTDAGTAISVLYGNKLYSITK